MTVDIYLRRLDDGGSEDDDGRDGGSEDDDGSDGGSDGGSDDDDIHSGYLPTENK